jgi:hypothetical protein
MLGHLCLLGSAVPAFPQLPKNGFAFLRQQQNGMCAQSPKWKKTLSIASYRNDIASFSACYLTRGIIFQ